ncbi:hypothetical protein GGF32_010055 [Allomyces javanicus]|nr:hypothetical protein GGF32_010055 [Allomyces javanicus]
MDPAVQERQDNEVEAIKAIFVDEFETITTQNVWKVAPAGPARPHFRLRLSPSAEHTAIKTQVHLDLEVKFTRNYPHEVPELTLGKSTGVDRGQLPTLLATLRTKARELRGQEMVYELATFVQDWLASNHSVKVIAGPLAAGVPSSYERMQSRHELERQQQVSQLRLREIQEQKAREKEAEHQSAQLEMHLERENARRAQLKEAWKRARAAREANGLGGVAGTTCPWAQLIDVPVADGASEVALAALVPAGRRFHLGRAVALAPELPDSPIFDSLVILRRLSATVVTAPSGKQGDLSICPSQVVRLLCSDAHSELLIMAHVLRTTNAGAAASLLEDLRELAVTCTLATDHPHICTFYDFLIHHDDNTWSFLALEEACPDGTLERLITQCRKLEINLACSYVAQILDALAHLHRTTSHDCVDLTHILVTSDGAVKLSCVTAAMGSRGPAWPPAWQTDLEDARGRDIYHVALVFLVLVIGPTVLEWYTPATVMSLWQADGGPAGTAGAGSTRSTPTAPRGNGADRSPGEGLAAKEAREILHRIPKSLKEALASMLTHTHRPAAQLAIYFASLARRVQPLAGQVALDSLAAIHVAPTLPLGTSPHTGGFLSQMVGASAGATAAPSRYKSDFEEVEYVGHGGFGQVVKARNKLDGRVYAIKTVRLSRDDNENRKLLREVRTLSRLSSVRCVRYYQAWIEDAQGMWMEGSSDEDDEETSCGNDDTESSESESESSSDDESRGGSDDDDESEEESTSAGNGPFWATRPSSSGTDSASSGFSTSDSSGRDNAAAMNEARLMFASDPDDELDWISFDRSKSFKRRPQQPRQGKGAASRRVSTDSESESDSEPSTRRGRGRGRPGPGPGPRAIPMPQRRRTRTGTTLSSGDAASGDSLGSSQKNLFIQMEYCENRTLSDVIEQGITANEAWRLFHQIVEGLVHIHSQGMIHRDVKPKNIFLDADNNVKIGDFGLATTFLFTAAQSLDVLEGSMGNLSVSRGAGTAPRPIPGTEIKIEDTQRSLTSDVGTALYVAPELKSGHSKYNQKVDIYSLGIILFELFHRFSTGMERATTLLRLRQPEIIFPPEFPESPQKCLIQWLLNHDPRLRPTSMEVLQSHLLPTTFEDEVLQEAMRAMTNPANTTHYSKLIHSLFSHAPDPLKDFTYDEPQPLDAQAARSLTCVQDIVTRVFRLHGAVAFNAPLLAPTNEMYAGKRMAQFVDAHGQLVMLPFDLTVPFARWVARNPVQTLTRRFAWGNVYRENGLGGQPRAVLETDFDIVAPAPRRGVDGTAKNGTATDPVVVALRADQLAMEAEVIYVTTQVLDAFPPLRQRPLGYHLVVNHTLLIDAVFAGARVPDHQQAVVSATLDQMFKSPVAQVRAKLLTQLSRRCVEALVPFVEPQPLAAILPHLRSLRDSLAANLATAALAARADACMQQLQRLDAHLRALGVTATMLVCPLLTYNLAQYRGGLVFQARINAPGQRADVIASGGRYDALVAQFAHPARRATVGPQSPAGSAAGAGAVATPVVACGVHVAVQKLAWIHRQQFPKSTATQVVVASFGTGLLTERMKLAKELWQAGVACEYLYEENTPADMVAQQCKLKGIAAVVFVKSDSASGTVKVRHIRSKAETDVPRATVVDHVARLVGADAAAAAEAGHLVVTPAALGGGMWAGGAAPAATTGPGSPMQLNTNHHHGHGHHHGHHHAAPAPAASGPASIITSTAVMKKLKHKQRQMILEKAVVSVGRGIGDVVASPVLAVYSLSLPALRALAADLSRNLGSGAATTTLTDLPLSSADRELVQQVVAAVGKLKAAGHRFCFLYSVTQDAHCVVSLG